MLVHVEEFKQRTSVWCLDVYILVLSAVYSQLFAVNTELKLG